MFTPTTARFWHMLPHGGLVKIKLRQGQCVHHSYGGPTDEGYSYTGETWWWDGDRVVSEFTTRSQDCDGRMDYHGRAECPTFSLNHGFSDPENPGVRFPRWNDLRQSQRDYSAEAMGY